LLFPFFDFGILLVAATFLSASCVNDRVVEVFLLVYLDIEVHVEVDVDLRLRKLLTRHRLEMVVPRRFWFFSGWLVRFHVLTDWSVVDKSRVRCCKVPLCDLR